TWTGHHQPPRANPGDTTATHQTTRLTHTHSPGHPLDLAADLVAGDDVQAGRRPPLAARSGLDIEGATWTIPWTFKGLASTRWIRRNTPGSIPLRLMRVSIDRHARRPTRASTAARPRAACGISRRAGESHDDAPIPAPPQAAP